MANYKALRLVPSRPFAPEKPPERIRERPGVWGVSGRLVPEHHSVHLAPSLRAAV